MSSDFAGKVCVVTGGAAGIGEAICEAMANEGADVAVVDVNIDQASTLAGRLPRARAFRCDVSSSSDVDDCMRRVLSQFGRVDVLVNNAGIIGGDEYRRTLERRVQQLEEIRTSGRVETALNCTAELSDEQWRAMLSVHLDGTFFWTRAVIPGMQSRRSGAIVNMTSIIGLDGGVGVPHYAAAKAGIIGLTRSIAQELAPFGIRVNAVAPGFIRTAMRSSVPEPIAVGHVRATPLGRLGEPREIADAVLYLASDRASFVAGQVLSPNGAYMSR